MERGIDRFRAIVLSGPSPDLIRLEDGTRFYTTLMLVRLPKHAAVGIAWAVLPHEWRQKRIPKEGDEVVVFCSKPDEIRNTPYVIESLV